MKIKAERRFAGIALFFAGLLIILYFSFSSLSWGRFDIFNFLVSLCGLFLMVVSFMTDRVISFIKRIPKTVKIVLIVLLSCFVISFIIVNSLIISNMRRTAKSDADYIVVLGCQVVGEYASLPLLQRGFAAIGYLNNNPGTRAVLSGGQGPGENIPEAEALRRLLRERDIPGERILLETKSANTTQNLSFSHELYDLMDKNIVIVSSDYHLFRALAIAKKLGYKNISGLPAQSRKIMRPAYIAREYVTVMYYALTGRI